MISSCTPPGDTNMMITRHGVGVDHRDQDVFLLIIRIIFYYDVYEGTYNGEKKPYTEVYSLNTNSWSRIHESVVVPCLASDQPPAFVNGAIHWKALSFSLRRHVIMYFNTSERVFGEIRLPVNAFDSIVGNQWRPTPFCMSDTNGVLCMSDTNYFNDSLYLWNPSVRNFKILPCLCTPPGNMNSMVTGHGIGPDHRDHDVLVIRIIYFYDTSTKTYNGKRKPRTEVYSLNTSSWSSITDESVVVPCYEFDEPSAFVNGAIHWKALSFALVRPVIMYFNTAKREFGEIRLPVNCFDHMVHLMWIL
ncbi:F-box/kelch-repeat protein At3g23880-like isoform X1 [Fagus crenata]